MTKVTSVLRLLYKNINNPCEWNMKDKDNRYYHIVTISMEWEDKLYYAHFINDITQKKCRNVCTYKLELMH